MIVELTPLHEQAIEAVARAIAPKCQCDYPGPGTCCHTSRTWNELAAFWLGHLEAVNDMTLAGIVEAAKAATCTHGFDAPCDFDASAFFAARAVEGIAKGTEPIHECGPNCNASGHGAGVEPKIPSWFDTRAVFRLSVSTRQFTIPAIRIGGAE